jgi:hypothetical protein
VSRQRHSYGLLQYEPKANQTAPYGAEAKGREATDLKEGAVQRMWFRLLRLLKYSTPLPPITAADLRSLGPVHACSCGCTVFNVFAQFDDYDIAWWGLDATCANCGNLVRIPCPVDKEENSF